MLDTADTADSHKHPSPLQILNNVITLPSEPGDESVQVFT